MLLHWRKTISPFRKKDSKLSWLRYEEIAQDFRPAILREPFHRFSAPPNFQLGSNRLERRQRDPLCLDSSKSLSVIASVGYWLIEKGQRLNSFLIWSTISSNKECFIYNVVFDGVSPRIRKTSPGSIWPLLMDLTRIPSVP